MGDQNYKCGWKLLQSQPEGASSNPPTAELHLWEGWFLSTGATLLLFLAVDYSCMFNKLHFFNFPPALPSLLYYTDRNASATFNITTYKLSLAFSPSIAFHFAGIPPTRASSIERSTFCLSHFAYTLRSGLCVAFFLILPTASTCRTSVCAQRHSSDMCWVHTLLTTA